MTKQLDVIDFQLPIGGNMNTLSDTEVKRYPNILDVICLIK